MVIRETYDLVIPIRRNNPDIEYMPHAPPGKYVISLEIDKDQDFDKIARAVVYQLKSTLYQKDK